MEYRKTLQHCCMVLSLLILAPTVARAQADDVIDGAEWDALWVFVTEMNKPVTYFGEVDSPVAGALILDEAPAHGTVSLVEQKITYTPHPGYHGIDLFTFRLFDGAQYSPLQSGRVLVIEPKLTLETTIVGQFSNPTIAIDTVGQRLYIREFASDLRDPSDVVISVFDRASLSRLGSFPLQRGDLRGEPQQVAVDPARRRLYVSERVTQSIWIYDLELPLSEEALLAVVPVGAAEMGNGLNAGFAVNYSSGWFYVVAGGRLYAITPDFVRVEVMPGRYFVEAVHIDSANGLIYVPGRRSEEAGRITIIDGRQWLSDGTANPSFHQLLTSFGPASTSSDFGAAFAIDPRNDTLFLPHWEYEEDVRMIDTPVLNFYDRIINYPMMQRWNLGDAGSPDAYDLVGEMYGGSVYALFNWVETNNWQASALGLNPVANRTYVRMENMRCTSGHYNGPAQQRSNQVGIATVDSATGQFLSEQWFDSDPRCGVDSVVIDPAYDRLFLFRSHNHGNIDVYNDQTATSAATRVGSSVEVTTPQVTLTFGTVASAGVTRVEPVSPGSIDAALPANFSVEGVLTYEVTTTATFSGPIQLCFNASHVTNPVEFGSLRLLHRENGVWEDRTTSRDYHSGSICGVVTSLSPFAIAERVEPTYEVVPLYDTGTVYKSGRTVPVKIGVRQRGVSVASASLPVAAIGLTFINSGTTGPVIDSGTSNADANFRFDSSIGVSGGYIYNLSTKGLRSGTYELRFNIGTEKKFYKTLLQIE